MYRNTAQLSILARNINGLTAGQRVETKGTEYMPEAALNPCCPKTYMYIL